MSKLQITSRWRIHDGKLDEFKKEAERCLSIVKEKDKDTLVFDWYFSEDQTEYVVIETYPDSNALLAHLGNLGDLFGRLLQVADFQSEIYGSPSAELINATKGLKIKVYTFYQGT
jgi:quinol monooxygenase YgiN